LKRYQREVIRIRKSKKNRQHNDQKKRIQKDKQRSTKHTYKTKDRVTRTPLKTEGLKRYQREVIRIRISKKNRQHNDQKKRIQKDKQRSTKHTYKTKDPVTRIPLKTGVNSGAPEGNCILNNIYYSH
jgi:hypothetical protein